MNTNSEIKKYRKSGTLGNERLRKNLPVFFVSVIVLADLIAVFILSILVVDFDLEKLKTGAFWAQYAVTTVLIFIAYFALISLGSHFANFSDELKSVKEQLRDEQDLINGLVISHKFEFYINCNNMMEKCRAIVNRLDRKLKRYKNEAKRTKIINIKIAAIYQIRLEEHKIKERTLTETEKKEYEEYISNCNFNPDNYRLLKYRRIDKRIIISSKRGSSLKVGKYSAGKIITSESIIKLLFSMVSTFVLTALLLKSGEWTKEGIFNIVWRIMMISMNSYLGYNMGYDMVMGDKLAALSERLDVFLKFKYFGIKDGIIVEQEYKTINKI